MKTLSIEIQTTVMKFSYIYMKYMMVNFVINIRKGFLEFVLSSNNFERKL